jgi:uncharacterized protein with PIN domain
MNLASRVAITALLVSAVLPSRAETPAERELQQLIEQRDKAIAPINARFNAAAEQLIRKATQAGDLATVEKVKVEMANSALPGSAKSARELKVQLAGTTWRMPSSATVRPGLAATLNFTEKTVEPGGFTYETDAHNKVTIMFKGGDTQVAQISQDGKQMKVLFGKNTFVYELVPRS